MVDRPCLPGNVCSTEVWGRAFDEAARSTEASRKYNIRRLEREANATPLQLGDSVAIAVHERDKLERHWDAGYVVTRIRGG